ncbi:hypothetical protein JZO75_03780 [Vagococcus fluvialis]|nr:hypothetical protein [Vagococcus fluvialis]
MKSYFPGDNEAKKAIGAKFTNISGKTGQYFVSDTLFQKRTPRKNRVLIPFEHVVDSNITYDELNTFEGGVVVEFVNNDYFDQLILPESHQNEVFKQLKNKLGSDDNVSAMINIRSTGVSSSQTQREALIKVEEFLNNKGIPFQDALIRRKTNVIYSGQGNDKWEGFLHYTIKGGQQDVTDSHVKYGIVSTQVQLFNPSVEYAGDMVSTDLTLVLIYFTFFSVPIERRDISWDTIVSDYENYFKNRVYDSGNLYDYVSHHISLKLEPGILIDPIQVEPIYIEDFTLKGRDENALDLTHQVSVKKHSYRFDTQLKVLLTPARPTNIFWSKHLSNMMQQDFSLKEYFTHQREVMKKWDEFGLENIEEI